MFLFKVMLFILLVYELHGYPQQWPKQSGGTFTPDTTARKSSMSRIIDDGVHVSIGSSSGEANDGESYAEATDHAVEPHFGVKIEIPTGPVPICENSTFCEDIPKYPADLVDRQIKKNPSLLNYADVDAINNIAEQMDMSDEEPLCIATEKVVYPKSAESANKTWLFVVNQKNFSQGVRIETCLEENSSCKVIDGFAEGYVTACKQKFVYRQLSAVTSDGWVTRESFRFPASCCCHVQFIGAMTGFRRSFTSRKRRDA